MRCIIQRVSSDCIKKLTNKISSARLSWGFLYTPGNWIASKWNARLKNYFPSRFGLASKASANKFQTPPHNRLQIHFKRFPTNLDFALNIFLTNTFRSPFALFQFKICLRHKICVLHQADLLSALTRPATTWLLQFACVKRRAMAYLCNRCRAFEFVEPNS